MERVTITRTWGIAAVIILAIIGLVAAFLLVSGPSRMQAAQPQAPAITAQWRAQSILESKFTARVIEDNKRIKAMFEKGQPPEEAFKGTYLQKLRIWNDAKREWLSGGDAIAAFKSIVQDPKALSIDSISIAIEYTPYVEGTSLETDVDAVATVRITFSASPAENIGEGELLHRRVCTII
jgi:hypothetical protein